MAPRKKQSSRVPRTSTALQADPANTKVAKATNFKKTIPGRAARLAQKIQDTPVVILENGLVSMEKTPEHLVEIVERNARDSPLLRLPGEIRNAIWALAMGGHYINVEEVIHDMRKQWYWKKIAYRTMVNLNVQTAQPTAFHLPEVCRQIYSETATLGYKINTFMIDRDGLSGEWLDGLLLAQRSAITAIVQHAILFERVVINRFSPSLRTSFPNLNRIEVPRIAINFVECFHKTADPTGLWTKEQWREWAVSKVKEKEGEDIEILFYDSSLGLPRDRT